MHLVRGESAGGVLKLFLGSGDVAAFPDSLSCGPASPVGDPSAWFQERIAYWQDACGPGHPTLDDAETWARSVLSSAELTLWLGVGPDDQLFAGWLGALLLSQGSNAKLDIVQVEHLVSRGGGRFEVPSLGIVSPQELTQAPAPVRQSAADLECLATVWSVWAAPTPHALLDYIGDSDHPRVARRAFAALLDRYPLLGCGLNRWERLALAHVRAHQPDLVRAVGYTLADALTDGIDLIGDAWLYWRFRRLARRTLRQPLLTLDMDTPVMRGRTVELTPVGEAVLAGEADALELNGLDDRVGGVTLHYPDGPIWLRTDEGLTKKVL